MITFCEFRFPPVFFRWFFERFPSLSTWSEATNLYRDSLAVMNMVGFIVGLGDRHGENILFDENSGSCVHVDFNCLFEKVRSITHGSQCAYYAGKNL
jgi:serine/threonine-protein kinase ATR